MRASHESRKNGCQPTMALLKAWGNSVSDDSISATVTLAGVEVALLYLKLTFWYENLNFLYCYKPVGLQFLKIENAVYVS